MVSLVEAPLVKAQLGMIAHVEGILTAVLVDTGAGPSCISHELFLRLSRLSPAIRESLRARFTPLDDTIVPEGDQNTPLAVVGVVRL